MEERLLFVGLAMGAFMWYARRLQNAGGPRTAAESAVLHGGFYFLAGFSASMVLAMSFESRARFISIAAHVVSTAELYPSLAIGAVAGGLGAWRAWSKGDSVESRRFFLGEDIEWADTVFSATLLAWLLMSFVLQAFKIPSSSMERTLLIGDHLFVNKFLYGLRVPFTGKRVMQLKPPSRGDIVVFRFPVDDPRELHCGSLQFGKDFIKRVIGVPGDKVQVIEGKVYLNDKPIGEEPYAQWTGQYREPESLRAKELSKERYQELWQNHRLDMELQDVMKDHFGPVVVPAKSYFAMGDNRDASCDSRYWGPVEERYIKGKAWFLYWPPSRMAAVR